MDWLALTGLSVVSRAIYGVMTKVLSNRQKTSTYTQSVLLPLCAAVLVVFAAPLLGGFNFNWQHVSLLAIALVVLGQGLGNVLYFQSIKSITSSTAQIAFSSILVFNTGLSLIFLHLHLSPLNIFGIALLLLAVTSVVTGKIELDRRGVALMVLSAFMFAVFQLASSELSKQVGAVMYLLIAYIGAAAVVFVLRPKPILHDLQKTKRVSDLLGISVVTALPSVGNFVFAYYAYRSAPEPAKVAILLTSQVVLTVLLSYIFLGERTQLRRKFAAAALVIVAAFLIKG